jgi:hypothetical protein
MNAAEHARQLYQAHYMILLDADSDISEECLISVLAIQHARVSAMQINDIQHRDEVIKELETL